MVKPEQRAVTTIGLLDATIGYEVFDPNNATAPPQHVIGWLIVEQNGANITKPLTTAGDPPTGWQLRYRGQAAPAAV